MTQKPLPNGTISTEVNNNIKGQHKKHPSSSFLSKFIALPQGLRVKSKGGESEGNQSPRRPVPVKALPSGGFINQPQDFIEDLTEANNNVFIHLEQRENNSSIPNSPLTQHSRNPSVSSFASSQDGGSINSDDSFTPRRSGRYRKRSSSTPPDIGRQRSSPVDRRIGRLANQYYQAVYSNNNNSSKNVNTTSPADRTTSLSSRHSNSTDTGISLDSDSSDDSFDFGEIEDVDFNGYFSPPRESSTPLDYYSHPSAPVTQAGNFSPAGVKTMMHPHYLTLPRNTKFQSDSVGLVKVDNSLRPMAYSNGTVPHGKLMTAGGSLKLKSPGLVVYKPPPGPSGDFIMMSEHSLHNGGPGSVPFKSQGVTDIRDLPSNRVGHQEASNLYSSRALSSSMPTLLGNATPKEQKKFLKEVKKLEKEERKRREKEEKRRIKEEKKREKTLRKQKKYIHRTLPRNWVSGYVERPIENVYHRRSQLQFSAVPIDFEDGPPTHRSNPPPNSPPPPPPQTPQTLQQGPSLKAQAFYNSAPDLLRLEKVYGGSIRGEPKEIYRESNSITNGGFSLHRNIPNTHYYSEYAPRSVVLQKGPEGYGFVLRGAKSQTQATAELDFRPSAEFPALQYLDSVDPGSRADRAGLKTGDFILEINGENVVRASHDRVVQLIRQSGDTLALKVVTVKPLEKPEHWLQHHNGTMTLPNRGGARRQAPQPPQRDPQTSLSVGKAQGKQYAEGMAELERTVQELNSSTEDQLDLALAEYEKQTVQSVVSSEQKTASIRSKHSAKRVSCVELDKIENPDSKSATSKGRAKDYMSPSEIRIQKYHHQKKNGNLERSSSTPSLVDKKEAVYATPTVPNTEQNDVGHRRSSSGAAVTHIYATPGERPRAPPPPPPANATQSSPKRPAPAPPRPQSEIVSISTDRRKSASSITDSLPSSDKPSSEYESSFRPGISAQLSTEPKISTPSLQQVKLRSHNRNSSQVSLQSNDSGGSKRSEEKLGVTFADDKIQDHANQFLQKHPNAQLLVTADVHAKNKDRKVSEPEPDYDIDESDAKTNKVTVISVGGGIDTSKKFTVKSDIPSGGGGRVIPPPPSEPAPKPPSHKPPSPLPKPFKQDAEVRYSPLSDKKVVVESNLKNIETSSVKSEDAVYATVSKSSEPEPPKAPPAPPAPPPPPPAPPAPGVSAPIEKPKTPPPPVMEKKPKAAVQGIPSKDIMEAVLLRKTRIESEGMKISKGPNKEAPVKDGNDLRNRMLDNTHSAILAAVAKRRALLEEKDSDHSVAEEIENRLQKTKKLQSAKYFFSSETIQKKEVEKTNKIETKADNGPKEITPTVVKPVTPTTVSSKTTKPPSPVPSKKTKPASPVPSKKTKPPSPAPVRKISPPTPGAKTLPFATKSTTSAASTTGLTRTMEKTQAEPKPIYSSSAKPPSPRLKKAPSPVPVKSPVAETASDKPKETKSKTLASTEKDDTKKERDENEDLLAKAEKARLDWLQKKSSSTSLKSPRDVTRNPSKLNSPRRTASKAGANTEGIDAKKETSTTKSTPKTNGMTLPLKSEPNNTSVQPKAKSPVQIQPAKSTEKSGITPMKTTKESDLLLKNKNIRDRIANFEKGKTVVNGKSDPDSKIPVHGVTVDSSVTDKSPALPPPPEFGDTVQLEIIPPPSGFNLSDNLESPTYNSVFHHSDSSSVSTLSTLSDDHVDAKMKHSYEDLIAPPPPGFGDNNEDSLPSVIPPPPDFGESKHGVKSNQTVNKPFLSKPLSSWQCLDVLDWLDSIQMAQYKKSFQQHCIDGKKLGGLQRNDYIQLGVTQVGHRMTMERAIKKASNIITGTHL